MSYVIELNYEVVDTGAKDTFGKGLPKQESKKATEEMGIPYKGQEKEAPSQIVVAPKADYLIELNYESILFLSKVTPEKGLPQRDGIRAIAGKSILLYQQKRELLAQLIEAGRLSKREIREITALAVEASGDFKAQGIRGNESSFRMLLRTDLRVVESLSVSQALIISYPIPSTITGLVAIDLKCGDAIRLYWNAITDPFIVGYAIYRAEAEASPFSKVYTTIHNEYIDGGLTLNKTYWFKVRAVNRAGQEGAD